MVSSPSSTGKDHNGLANNPGWSEIRETILMLDFAVARMSHAMSDGNDSVDTLIESFTHMAKEVESIQDTANSLNENEQKETMLKQCTSIHNNMNQAITAFQFYDRLSQRMQHITNSLDSMSNLITQEDQRIDCEKWQDLKSMIRANYTLESDKRMFESLLSGTSVSEIINQAAQSANSSEVGEIELF